MQSLTKTSYRQISLFTEEELTSLAVGSPANPTQRQGKDSARRMTATFGLKCCERFGKFSRHGSWAKTFSALLIGMTGWYSTRCKLTWKLKGTKYNRMYFQLYPSTLPIEETGFGLLPTPEHYDYNSARHPELWEKDKKKYAEKGINLHCNLRQQARLGMLPTPTFNEGKNATFPKSQENRSSLIGHIMQTETVGKTSQLNPRFVAEMMGFPPNWTELPFQSGETNPSKGMAMP
jgi:hypothetical protein